MITRFGDVLKAWRRGAHVWAHQWNGIVLCPDLFTLENAWEETLNIMGASSHAAGMKINKMARKIETANGASLRFAMVAADDMYDEAKLRLAGREFTHIIWCGYSNPDTRVIEFAEARKRSPVVPPEDMKTHFTDV